MVVRDYHGVRILRKGILEYGAFVCEVTAGKRAILEYGAFAGGYLAHKRAILEYAFSQDADAVIIAHNHPGAPAAPSHSDIILTRETAKLLAETGIRLADHIITGTDGFISLAATEKFADLFK